MDNQKINDVLFILGNMRDELDCELDRQEKVAHYFGLKEELRVGLSVCISHLIEAKKGE